MIYNEGTLAQIDPKITYRPENGESVLLSAGTKYVLIVDPVKRTFRVESRLLFVIKSWLNGIPWFMRKKAV